MSIDIKSLRIGAHVGFKGERVKVVHINDYVGVSCERKPNGIIGAGYTKELKPIPITPELLAELGFEKSKVPTRDYEKGNEVFVTNLSDNRYRFEIWTDDCSHGNIIARYLHELEFFYYHVFKKEMIEE